MLSPAMMVALPFLTAIFVPYLFKLIGERARFIVVIVPVLVFVWGLQELQTLSSAGSYVSAVNWVPSLSVQLYFLVDGLSLLFTLLISGIGILIVIYGGSYLAGNPYLARFYLVLLVFMGAMLGTVLSDNLILLFIFWELTSLSSYLLIGFKHGSQTARKAALQALLVTGSGGLLMLFGLVLLGEGAGTYQLSEIFENRHLVLDSPHLSAMIILLLLGAFTKSAQFPFHFWLPNAMEAPTPVSAYLHSATMVKAGIFLIARLTPIFAGVALWTNAVTVVGFITFLVGAFLSLRRFDLKQILAYTTVSSLGIIVFLLGIGTDTAVIAAFVFLVAHACYKGALFMIAGIIDYQAGSRDVRDLGGLLKLMPITAGVAILAWLSMIGIPPLAGFIAKELFYEVFELSPTFLAISTLALAFLGMAALIAAASTLVLLPLFRRDVQYDRRISDPRFEMWLPPAVLAVAGLFGGILAFQVGQGLIYPAVLAVAGSTVPVSLKLWHGFNLILLISFLTLLLGLGIFTIVRKVQDSNRLLSLESYGPEAIYDMLYNGLIKFAALQTRVIQSGYMRNYLLIIIFFAISLISVALFHKGLIPTLMSLPPKIVWHEALLGVVVLVGCLTLINSKSRLGAVAALGVVGYGTALFFIFFSAPDLAMTQFAIETLAVILFIFVLYRLPNFSSLSSRLVRIRDATVAISFGSLMALLVLFILSYPLEQRVTPYFAENSYLLAKGRNVVNVILVDFRALDTLGEIVVIAVAAIGVHALLRLRVATGRDDK